MNDRPDLRLCKRPELVLCVLTEHVPRVVESGGRRLG
jgi:hypothetical protein